MITKFLNAFSWKYAAVGAGAMMVFSSVGRPLLVSAVSTGMNTWKELVAETQKIKEEAMALEAKAKSDSTAIANVLAELKELRAAVASVSGKKTASANA